MNIDVNNISQLITNVGFAITMCGAMAFFIKYIIDKHREDIKELNTQHNLEITRLNEQHWSEMKEVTSAINNNTLALTKLCERLGSVD